MEQIKYDLKQTCRTCARNYRKLYPLFENERLLVVRFSHDEEYKVELRRNDGLPQNICSECLDRLIQINEFLKKCIESQQKFLQIFRKAEGVRINGLNEIKELKTEYNSELDENIDTLAEPNYCERKTTDLVIEKLNPLQTDIKSESNSYINNVPESNLNISICKSEHSEEEAIILECLSSSEENETAYEEQQTFCMFKCKICEEKFDKISEFKQHKKSHQDSKKPFKETFLCDLCGKEFVKQESLRDHTNIHLGVKPYKCDVCEKAFSVRNALRTHVAKHSKIETFTCKICGKTYSTKSYYIEHFKRHEKGDLLENNEKPFKCPHCPKTFKLLSTLSAHCNYHNKTSDRKYHCTECNTTFKRSDHLKEHINGVHLKILPFKCEICSKLFVTGAIRNAHVRKFHSGRRYKCNICEKDFSLSASLSRHKRCHTGDKRFICEICNMSFLAVYQIEKHMETHKIDETTKKNLISQTYEEISKAVIDLNEK